MTAMAYAVLPHRAPPRRRPPVAKLDPVTQYATDVVEGRVVTGEYVRKACQRHLDDLVHGHKRGLHFDAAIAKREILFYGLLHHYKGEWGTPTREFPRGRPIVLEPWQQFAIGSAFGWRRADGTRRFRRVYIEVGAKNGKALALDTPLPTPTGWTTMGEVRVGDELLDERGQPVAVTFATPVMRDRPCYRVAFSDGSAIVADAEHLWQTDHLRHDWESGVRTTAEIAASLTDHRGRRRHRIPVAAALALSETDLPLDPYTLGAWLGDGDSVGPILTVSDQDVAVLANVVGETFRRPPSGGRTPRYRIGGTGESHSRSEFGAGLRALGLIRNKHVPAAYLRASQGQRLALLQGLMDTDGSVTPRGQCEFTTTRAQLRDGFLELARSLGYKAVSREEVATLHGRAIGPKWRITFHGRRDLPPFRLARKLLRVLAGRPTAQRSSFRYIVAADPVPSMPVRCIQVDSPGHLFLAGPAMVPTHNTTIAAGLVVRLTFFDDEPGAQGYCIARKRDQAKIAWGDADQMVANSPSLSKRIKRFRTALVQTETASFLKPLGRDSDTEEGLNPHVALFDELHTYIDSELIDNVEKAMITRRQPMTVKITTAGVKRASVWWGERTDALAVVEGRVADDSMLVLVYTLDEADDPFDEAVWPKSNPSLGVTITLDALRREAAIAKRSPGKMAAFLRYHANVPTQQSTKAIDIDEWDANADEPQFTDGQAIFGGLDLASVKDLTALIGIARHEDGMYDVLARFWCPEDGIAERSRVDGVPYQQWADAGLLTATPGNITDYAYIRAEIAELAERYQVPEIGYDKWNATQLATELEQDGATMVPIPQTWSGLAPGWRELDRLILDHKLRHGGHPILRWMAGNVETEIDAAGNQRPSKARSPERIDGMVALDMALSRLMTTLVPEASVYEREDRGMLEIG